MFYLKTGEPESNTGLRASRYYIRGNKDSTDIKLYRFKNLNIFERKLGSKVQKKKSEQEPIIYNIYKIKMNYKKNHNETINCYFFRISHE